MSSKKNKEAIISAAGQAISLGDVVEAIRTTDSLILEQTTKAVNVGLTLRNWLFGRYIHTYELEGSDRAAYGAKIYASLAVELQKYRISRVEERELRRYVKFYTTYPQIREALTPEFVPQIPPTALSSIRESVTPEFAVHELSPRPGDLLTKLSFTMIAELLQIEDPLKRVFYEREAIRSNWSVRELKRQVGTLLFERTGLSEDKKAVIERTAKGAERMSPGMVIRDPYIFEFMGIKTYEALNESQLEAELLGKLENFLLELGYGFCLEGRRKRILIGDEYYFIDVVLYHRILKCHVLIELKMDRFNHRDLGQLNAYVTYYKKHEMTEGDNPPIGILLCTEKSDAKDSIVEYALAGMDNQLFVSRYSVALPKREELKRFLEEQM